MSPSHLEQQYFARRAAQSRAAAAAAQDRCAIRAHRVLASEYARRAGSAEASAFDPDPPERCRQDDRP